MGSRALGGLSRVLAGTALGGLSLSRLRGSLRDGSRWEDTGTLGGLPGDSLRDVSRD